MAETLRISLAGYTSQRLHASGEKGMSGLLGEDDGGSTVLGEAQAELKLDQPALFFGRSRIDLPFINGNDTRMTPSNFEVIGARTQALQNMQLGFGHLAKIKSLDSSDFVSMSEQAGALGSDRGVSVLGLRYNFSDDFHIPLVEEYGWDMFNTIYLESDRMFALTDDLNLRVGAQFTNQRSVGEEILDNFRTGSAGVQTDPIHINGRDFNLYAYAGKNPLSFTDPLGTSAIEWGELVDLSSFYVTALCRLGNCVGTLWIGVVEGVVNLTPPANPVPVKECTIDFIGVDPCSANSLLGFAGGYMAGYLGTGGSTPGVRGAGQRFGFFLTVKGTIESCKGMSFEAKPNKVCDKGFGL